MALDILFAAETSDLENLKHFSHKDSLNTQNLKGESPISIASKNGDLEMLEYLISCSVNINTTNNVLNKQLGETPLILSVLYNHLPCVQALLKAGANINKQDSQGWTALINSVHHDFFEITGCLLRWKADINLVDKVIFIEFGKKALDRAKNVSMINLIKNEEAIRRKTKTKPKNLSIRSESEPAFTPPQQTPKIKKPMNYTKRKQIKSEIESHLTLTARNLQNRMISSLKQNLKFELLKEFENSEDFLEQQVRILVGKFSADLFEKLKPVASSVPSLEQPSFLLVKQDISKSIKEGFGGIENFLLSLAIQKSSQDLDFHIQNTRNILKEQIYSQIRSIYLEIEESFIEKEYMQEEIIRRPPVEKVPNRLHEFLQLENSRL